MTNISFSRETNGFDDTLPAYATMLAAFHRACAADLHRIVRDLPLRKGDRVLDLACGDGVYLPWLAERVVPNGSVVGVDLSPAFLRVAQQHVANSPYSDIINLERGNIKRLPYPDDHFDVIWCAHSLYSLPDPLQALKEMRRVVRKGGQVIILENDTLHHHLLPWPPAVELAVRQAQRDHLARSIKNSDKFYIGRNIGQVMDEAGLTDCQINTYTINHVAPLSDDELLFFNAYLNDVKQRATPYLADAIRQQFAAITDPTSSDFLLNDRHFFACHLEIIARGIK